MKIGDIVRLKGHPVKMTVIGTDVFQKNNIEVAWFIPFGTGELQLGAFPEAALEIVEA